MSKTTALGNCIGNATLFLTLLFIILKATNVIDWGWVWVFSPIWISVGISLALISVSFFLFLLAGGGE